MYMGGVGFFLGSWYSLQGEGLKFYQLRTLGKAHMPIFQTMLLWGILGYTIGFTAGTNMFGDHAELKSLRRSAKIYRKEITAYKKEILE
jgi:hypothetical protein